MSKCKCSKVSFSFLLFLIQLFALLFVHRDYEEFRSALVWLQLDKFPRFLFCHTSRGVWNSLWRLQRKSHNRTYENISVVFDHSFFLFFRKSIAFTSSKVTGYNNVSQLSVRNTTFNKSSQLILYSARDKTF